MDGVEKIAFRKQIVVAELMRVTTLLRKAMEVDDLDSVERYVNERTRFFAELEALDRELASRPTSKDAEIVAMLKKLKEVDTDLLSFGMKGREMIFNEVIHTSKSIASILNQEAVESKGQSLNVRG